MINPDTQRGAQAIADTAATADEIGQLPCVVGDLAVLMGTGLFITLRELQAHLIDLELS